jgi:hypothetical protein
MIECLRDRMDKVTKSVIVSNVGWLNRPLLSFGQCTCNQFDSVMSITGFHCIKLLVYFFDCLVQIISNLFQMILNTTRTWGMHMKTGFNDFIFLNNKKKRKKRGFNYFKH